MSEWRNAGSEHVIRPTKQLSQRKSMRLRKRHFRESVHRFEHSSFPLFGLPPSWTGYRWLAGSSGGGSDRRKETVEALVLGHRPSETDNARLLVQAEAPGLAQGHTELQVIAENLWRNGAADIDEAIEWYDLGRRSRPHPDVEWPEASESTIEVDGSATRFRVLTRSDSWVGSTELANVWITLEGSQFGIDEVALVTVLDLRPYIDATRAFLFPQGT